MSPVKKQKTIEEKVKKLLEESYWLTTLKTDERYFRTHDDCDGELSEGIGVIIDEMGDVFVETTKQYGCCRFRTYGGGGASLRVRNALLILAEAIRLDNTERRPL